MPRMLAIALTLGLLGIAYLTYTGYQTHKIRRCQTWPSVSGKILQSQSVSTEKKFGKYSKTKRHQYLLSYQYIVNDITYTGSRLQFGPRIGSIYQIQQLVKRFPLHSTHPVFYNPDHPSESVLLKTPLSQPQPWFAWILLLIAALLASVHHFSPFSRNHRVDNSVGIPAEKN